MIMQRIFPKLLLMHVPLVVIGVKFVSTFVDWRDQSLVTNLEVDARAEEDVNEFKYSHMEFVVCIFYNFIEDTVNITGLSGLEGLYFVL